ncbi:MAG: nitrogenase (molybdenum-iron)-specific transcriptional regulator NifA [Geminicoccaceae bacterium]|nr:nitrogenase (molybdenum-iron)-specific transcriptional regulator NifA [Geminicoccaceae bacterium]
MTDQSRGIRFQAPELLPGPSDDPPTQPGVSTPRRARTETSEARKLGTLVDVSQALAGSVNLPAGLSGVLGILARRCAVVRGAVALLDDHTRELQIRAAIGLSREGQSTRYRVGEGITGTVAQSGEPMVIAEISRDPRFLHRAAGRQERREGEFSFVCVPIVLHRRVVGTLSVELAHKPDREFERLLKFLKVVASMISQGVRIHRLLETERQKLVAENAQLRQELLGKYDFSSMVGSSGPMRQMYEEMARVAGTNTTVLIRGESGTGKELIASAIHYHSSRAKKPFIKVNCAALPETLVESELFGHERGAFTGAESRKKGRFEMANGGTLFLDEIGELDRGIQVKLLRVLQEREFERVGGTDPVRVDVRVIAATNRDLEKGLTEGSFREDLYYRLNVFPIFIPPLRARRPDILPLADHFAQKYASQHGKTIKRISTPAIDQLACYHWPGNVRELENTIERAVLMADGEVIHGHHLPPTLQTAEATGTVVSASLGGAVASFERSLIEDALKTTRGNRSKAARLLSTTERVINYKVKKYGIDPARLRA